MKKLKLLLGLASTMFALLPNNAQAQMTTLSATISDSLYTYCKLPTIADFGVYANGAGTGTSADSITFNVNFGDGSDTTFKRGLSFGSSIGYANAWIKHTYTIPGTFTTRVIAVAPSGVRDTSYGTGFTLTNTCGTLNGKLYIDTNANCLFDATEEAMRYMPIVAINTTTLDTVTAGWADHLGAYSLNLIPGNYNIIPCYYYRSGSGIVNANPFGAPSCPATGAYTLTVAAAGAYTKDFAYTCSGTPASFDAKVNVSGGCFFPGDTTNVYFWGGSWLWYYHYSCVAAGVSTTVTVGLDSKLTYLGRVYGPTPSVSGSTLTFTLSTPADVAYFYSGISVRTATTATIGDTIRINAYIAPLTGITDPYLANNTHNYKKAVVSSFDPNIKEVSPIGNGTAGYIKANEEMTYTIHFQNTGTAAARNITIVDEIDTDLDINSLHLLGTSHNASQHREGNKIRFRFENIYLPDSGSNYLGSMGAITYGIRQKKDLAPGTEMTNTAAIYFDYNDPIITNTTLNTINIPTSIADVAVAEAFAQVYPNPANTALTVKMNDNSAFAVAIYDMLGRVVMTQNSAKGTLTIDTTPLSEGLYIVRIANQQGAEMSSKVQIKH